MPVPRPARRRLPVAVATAAVLLLVTGLAGLTTAFWTLAGLVAVATAVAALAPAGGDRPDPAAPPSSVPSSVPSSTRPSGEVPADDADLATLLTL